MVFTAFYALARLQASPADLLRAAARKELGVIEDNQTWVMRGTSNFYGASQSFQFIFDNKSNWLQTATGPISMEEGDNGTMVWTRGLSGVPHEEFRHEKEISRIRAFVVNGEWTNPDGRVEILDLEDGRTCNLRLKGGTAMVKMTFDPVTFQPQQLSNWSPDGDETWTFSQWTRMNNLHIPKKWVHVQGGETDTITVSEVRLQRSYRPGYGMPKPLAGTGSFDVKAPRELKVMRRFGYVFVRPLINGQDLGWFFLDTGADLLVFDPTIIAKFKMQTVGKAPVAGVVASQSYDFVKGIDFELGGIKLNKPIGIGLDLQPFAKALNMPIVGICGYDVFCRSVVTIPAKGDTIRIDPPVPIAEAKGVEMEFHGNAPALECEFEGGRKAWFTLDTGSGSTVDFFSPLVASAKLLEGRKTSRIMSGGAGGSAESFAGPLEYFVLGPKRFEKTQAGFQVVKKGGFSSPWVGGNVGAGFLGKFDMTYDYPNRRLNFGIPASTN